ncbi:Hypothetical protein I596_2308 [Dokdonella koreensis DS-123]|uniref:Uncharacterized protein n=1 Tax=Dokdonella koreensis DS-123 TaxID=1300342 RepID=A0A160DUY1_9GAMM|nr:Hypothetical protein I596_2308 [Dokdonella koreensis DS-123]
MDGSLAERRRKPSLRAVGGATLPRPCGSKKDRSALFRHPARMPRPPAGSPA